ncbi:MAG TPA: flagellar biosynthetic protein FliO [Sinorhizobium sp.]|nr:flagellar biosynthetic protein FliO [Sinorhizobium sp.]
MMETIVGDNGSRFIIAAGAVAIGILCLVAVLWVMRNRASSPFVRGGKNRQPRLAVLDAAAVDTRRRLVLVRRDDVEHLIMIGGPTDIVIESRIVPDGVTAASDSARTIAEQKPIDAPIVAARAEPAPQPDDPVRAAPRPEPAPALRMTAQERSAPIAQPAPPPAARAASPAPAIPAVPASEPARESSSVPYERLHPVTRMAEAERSTPAASIPMEPKPAVPLQPTPIRPAPAPSASEFERMLDAEISSDLQRLAPTATPRQEGRPAANIRQEPVLGPAAGDARKEPTIDEEMTRMLADISSVRKL